MPELTVAIATKDRPTLLPGAVRSVLEQVDDIQVVVVDDGSSKENAAAIRRICAEDDRIDLIRNETARGAQAARNQALAHARGTYWAALDDDDRWVIGKWDGQRAILDRLGNPDDVVVVTAVRLGHADSVRIEDVPRVRDPESFEDVTTLFDRVSQRAFCHTMVVSVALMRELGGFDERLFWGEYTDLLIRMGRRARFAGMPDVGVVVNKRHEYASSRRERNWQAKLDGIRILMDKHRAVFQRDPVLTAQYLHIVGVTQLRNEDRWGAVGTFWRVVARSRGAGRRIRATGHLMLALVGGPQLWRSVARLRGKAADV